MRNRKRDGGGGGGAIDEVEELLRAAQDDVLLNLSLNSHIARSSSSDLDSDLSRRFHALKSRPSAAAAAPSQPQRQPSASSSSSSSSSPSTYPRQIDDELKAVLGDDLSARFAALRGSLYSSSSSSSSDAAAVAGPSVEAEGRDRREAGDLKSRGEDDQKEEDEVEKLIQWAVDAARLDPSAPSDDDDGLDNGNNDSDDEDEDDESEDESERKKNKQKNK